MISVVFSTHNGAHTLPRTLASFAALTPPAGGWELIAVDNASTDASAEILAAHADRLPLTWFTHPARGKNRALNAALSRIRGDLVMFTDDDVLAEPDWLVQAEQAAQRQPQADILGGAIRPHWEARPPQWMLDRLPIGVTYVVTAPELGEAEINPGLIWGPNMLVRRSVFDSGLRFNEAIGPAAGQYAMGSETEFNLRAAAAGHRCWFVPSMAVNHIIRAHQVQRRWVLDRAFRFGRNMWNEESSKGLIDRVPTWRGVPRWRVRSYVQHAWGALAARLRRDPARSFVHDWELKFLSGYFTQARTLRRRAE